MGMAEISLKANQPPVPGFLRILPQMGVAFKDTFDLEAVSFTDDADDLPFSYSFYYTDRVGKAVVIASALSFNIYSDALLPEVSK